MPIPFLSIPEHIKRQIVAKQRIRDFPRFIETSRETYKMARKLKTKFIFPAHSCTIENAEQSDDSTLMATLIIGDKEYKILIKDLIPLPVRIFGEAIRLLKPLTDILCESINSILISTHSSFFMADFEQISCSSESLISFLKLSKICAFSAKLQSSVLLEIAALKQIRLFSVEVSLNDEELLSLKTPSLGLFGTNISSAGLNLFLKEWINGKIELGISQIHTFEDLQESIILRGIPCTAGNTENNFETYILRRDDDRKIEFVIDSTRGDRKVFVNIVPIA